MQRRARPEEVTCAAHGSMDRFGTHRLAGIPLAQDPIAGHHVPVCRDDADWAAASRLDIPATNPETTTARS